MSQDNEKYDELLAYVRRLQNPYAWLGVLDDPDLVKHVPAVGLPAHRRRQPQSSATDSAGTVSKAEFRNICRRVFCQYIPQAEGRRIRQHHRDFILRNESRSPRVRHALLSALQKYDLSDIPGVTTQFNRERDPYTEEKLRKLEQTIEKADK